MAQSLFRLLREKDPTRAIDVVAPRWSLPVLQRMPEVRRGIALDVRHGEFGWGKRRSLGRELGARRYEQAIVLPRSAKAALVPWFAGIERRTGFKGELRFGLLNDIRPFDRARLDQTVKRFTALGLDPGESLPDALPRPLLTSNQVAQHDIRRKLGLGKNKPLIALLPGAEYGPAKCWPLANFGALARLLSQSDYRVAVLGGPGDRDAGDEIVNHSGGQAINCCGDTTLAEACDLLAACDAVVTNDSGLMHMAAAVGTRIVALYGSTSPHFTPPLTPRARIIHLELDCSPCFKRVCPLEHLNCLNGIRPERVMDELRALLAE
ncbi:MAG: lipopolysaccharide heptosyltransferase II [Pseudomonadota bacterium]